MNQSEQPELTPAERTKFGDWYAQELERDYGLTGQVTERRGNRSRMERAWAAAVAARVGCPDEGQRARELIGQLVEERAWNLYYGDEEAVPDDPKWPDLTDRQKARWLQAAEPVRIALERFVERFPAALGAVAASPDEPQRRDSLSDQIRTVQGLATRAGCYDAADWLRIASRMDANDYATPDASPLFAALRQAVQDRDSNEMRAREAEEMAAAGPAAEEELEWLRRERVRLLEDRATAEAEVQARHAVAGPADEDARELAWAAFCAGAGVDGDEDGFLSFWATWTAASAQTRLEVQGSLPADRPIICIECKEAGKRQVVEYRFGAWFCPVHHDRGHVEPEPAAGPADEGLRAAAQAVFDSVMPDTRSGRPTIDHDALKALAAALDAAAGCLPEDEKP